LKKVSLTNLGARSYIDYLIVNMFMHNIDWPDFGDWDRATQFYRDTFLFQRRTIFLGQLQARGLANQ
jgi:hypothetical protein